jgi:uncharacterized protein (DUF1684 family)
MMLATGVIAAGQNDYHAGMKRWRAEREAELKADDGWLTLVGLYWLKDGANRFGTDATNEIVLPEGTTRPHAGALEFHGGQTTLRMENGASAIVNGKPVATSALQTDEKQKPDVVRIGSLAIIIIKRGARYGVRVRDLNSKGRREFKGMRWFPVKEDFRITATFVAYDQPKDIEIANVLGDVSKQPSPGYALFTLGGKEYRLEPMLEGKDKLFFVFGDLTNNKTTYGAGRFLYADLPTDGKVVLDFNQAVNPPCAFTPFATCPLPPRQNRLKVAIEAGELNYHAASPATAR